MGSHPYHVSYYCRAYKRPSTHGLVLAIFLVLFSTSGREATKLQSLHPRTSNCNRKRPCFQDPSVRISLTSCTPKPWLGLRQPCTYLTRTFGSIFNSRPPPPNAPTHTVFVTGNAGKLKEVREILASGPQPIEIESRDLVDC